MDKTVEEILIDGNKDELDELKRFLFEENIKLSISKKELDDSIKKFNTEREAFKAEMETINLKVVRERQRLKDEETFFSKKMEILKNGFDELERDRQSLKRERISFEAEKKTTKDLHTEEAYEDLAGTFFAGVNNPLALRKRYRDLLKIFHPDNLCGDSSMVMMINREYDKLKNDMDYNFKSGS